MTLTRLTVICVSLALVIVTQAESSSSASSSQDEQVLPQQVVAKAVDAPAAIPDPDIASDIQDVDQVFKEVEQEAENLISKMDSSPGDLNPSERVDAAPQDQDTNVDTVPQDQDTNVDTAPQDQDTHVDTVPQDQDTNVDAAPQDQETNVDAAPQDQDTNVDTVPQDQDTNVDTAPQDQDTNVDTAPQDQDTNVDTAPQDQDTNVDTAPRDQDTNVDTAPQDQDTNVDTAPQDQDTNVDTAPQDQDTSVDTAPRDQDTNVDTAPQDQDLSVGAAPQDQDLSVGAAPQDQGSSIDTAPQKQDSIVDIASQDQDTIVEQPENTPLQDQEANEENAEDTLTQDEEVNADSSKDMPSQDQEVNVDTFEDTPLQNQDANTDDSDTDQDAHGWDQTKIANTYNKIHDEIIKKIHEWRAGKKNFDDAFGPSFGNDLEGNADTSEDDSSEEQGWDRTKIANSLEKIHDEIIKKIQEWKAGRKNFLDAFDPSKGDISKDQEENADASEDTSSEEQVWDRTKIAKYFKKIHDEITNKIDEWKAGNKNFFDTFGQSKEEILNDQEGNTDTSEDSSSEDQDVSADTFRKTFFDKVHGWDRAKLAKSFKKIHDEIIKKINEWKTGKKKFLDAFSHSRTDDESEETDATSDESVDAGSKKGESIDRGNTHREQQAEDSETFSQTMDAIVKQIQDLSAGIEDDRKQIGAAGAKLNQDFSKEALRSFLTLKKKLVKSIIEKARSIRSLNQKLTDLEIRYNKEHYYPRGKNPGQATSDESVDPGSKKGESIDSGNTHREQQAEDSETFSQTMDAIVKQIQDLSAGIEDDRKQIGAAGAKLNQDFSKEALRSFLTLKKKLVKSIIEKARSIRSLNQKLTDLEIRYNKEHHYHRGKNPGQDGHSIQDRPENEATINKDNSDPAASSSSSDASSLDEERASAQRLKQSPISGDSSLNLAAIADGSDANDDDSGISAASVAFICVAVGVVMAAAGVGLVKYRKRKRMYRHVSNPSPFETGTGGLSATAPGQHYGTLA